MKPHCAASLVVRRLAAWTATAALVLIATAPDASAKDMSQRLGLGGQLSSTDGGGLSLRYWFSELGLQATTSFLLSDPDGQDAFIDVGASVQVLWAAARAIDTNFIIGVGVTFHFVDTDSKVIDAVIGVEHFFTDYFGVTGHVGIHLDLADGVALDIGRVASWGTGFHFYF